MKRITRHPKRATKETGEEVTDRKKRKGPRGGEKKKLGSGEKGGCI